MLSRDDFVDGERYKFYFHLGSIKKSTRISYSSINLLVQKRESYFLQKETRKGHEKTYLINNFWENIGL